MVEEGVVITAFSQKKNGPAAHVCRLQKTNPATSAGFVWGQAGELAAAVSRLGKALGGAAGALVERGLGATETAFRTVAAAEAAFALGTVAEAGTIAEARTGVTVAAAETAFTRGTVAEGTIALVAAIALRTITEAGAVAERTGRAVAERTIALVAAFARCTVAIALVTAFTGLELATRGSAFTRAAERTAFAVALVLSLIHI